MRQPEPEKRIRSEARDNLEHRCAQCSYCHGQGLVTIFHDRYDGQPYIRLKNRHGITKLFALRVAVTCVCPLGFWMKGQRDPEDATAQRHATIDLQKVIEGLVPWGMTDPTAPAVDHGEVPDWKSFHDLYPGTKLGRAVTRVRPEPNGSRHGAYREMGEPLPGHAPQTARDWRSLPPVPDVPIVAQMAVAFVPDGSPPPF